MVFEKPVLLAADEHDDQCEHEGEKVVHDDFQRAADGRVDKQHNAEAAEGHADENRGNVQNAEKDAIANFLLADDLVKNEYEQAKQIAAENYQVALCTHRSEGHACRGNLVGTQICRDAVGETSAQCRDDGITVPPHGHQCNEGVHQADGIGLLGKPLDGCHGDERLEHAAQCR